MRPKDNRLITYDHQHSKVATNLDNWEASYIMCTSCAWPAYAVTRKEAEAAVERFNSYIDLQIQKEQESNYSGKRLTIDTYLRRIKCQSTTFR